MDQAVAHLKEHPEDSYRKVAAQFGVAYTTLYDRANKTHLSHSEGAHKNLTNVQEEHLIQEINKYADRGTLLCPHHVKTLAEKLCGHRVGTNWTSTFLGRNKDSLSSQYYRVQEASRITADTPETRVAFYELVSVFATQLATSEPDLHRFALVR